MEIKDYVEISAVVIGPVIAVCITLWYQNRQDKRKSKMSTFINIMAYRPCKRSKYH
jgi:hypothetical protein